MKGHPHICIGLDVTPKKVEKKEEKQHKAHTKKVLSNALTLEGLQKFGIRRLSFPQKHVEYSKGLMIGPHFSNLR